MTGYERNADSIKTIFSEFDIDPRTVRSAKTLTGKQKNDFIKKAMKMQGYNDKEANQMVNQSRITGYDWKKVEMTDHDMWDKGRYRISERLDYNPEIYDYDYQNPYYEVLDKITLHRERFDTLDEAMNWVDNRMVNQSRMIGSGVSPEMKDKIIEIVDKYGNGIKRDGEYSQMWDMLYRMTDISGLCNDGYTERLPNGYVKNVHSLQLKGGKNSGLRLVQISKERNGNSSEYQSYVE